MSLRVLAFGAVAAAAAIGRHAGCRGASTTTMSHAGAAGKEQPKNGRLAHYAYLRRSLCSASPSGYDVRVHGISCHTAERLIPPLANFVFTRHLRRRRELVYRSTNYLRAAGWTCWGELLHRYGPLKYVCLREGRALLFKFG